MEFTTIIQTVLTLLVGAGGCGLLTFFLNKRTQKHTENKDAITAWQELYKESKASLERLTEKNQVLSEQVASLQVKVNTLTIELENYRRFERYVAELELFNQTLLNTVKPLVTDDTYKRLEASKPIRVVLDVKKADIKTNSDPSHKVK